MSDPSLHPCFLGPYGENDGLLEPLVMESLREHVYWRRNFHPEDPPAIPTEAANTPAYREFSARMRRELHLLSAALKRSVPSHSPRYIGHMVSDLLLPGLAAHYLALPFNPNNVSADAAPVTIDMELKAGLQLAGMLGYPNDPQRADCAFGHLTSGGTTANYQAIRLALALKALPVALRAITPPGLVLPDDDMAAFNLHPSESLALWLDWQRWLGAEPAAARRGWRERLAAARIEHLGLAGFFAAHPALAVPCLLAPASAHYSWSKGTKLFGLGRAQLRTVPLRGMRMDAGALEALLEDCLARRQPVLMAVGVLGTTEFGTIDPIDALVDARDRFAARGLGFGVHVDAAWGGYLATLFREPDGRLRPREDVRADFAYFPSPEVHGAFAALGRTDSVTVDPHKLGYLPYGAGAFVCRDQRAADLLAEDADYVFDGADAPGYFARFRQLGRYMVEGSKSGASAAGVYVTHQVLPLHHAQFGLIPRQTIRAAEHFHDAVGRLSERLAGQVRLCLPYTPDTNLVCLAINPEGNRDVARMNAFVRALHAELRCEPDVPLQAHEFFGSLTTLRREALGEEETSRLLAYLGLDPTTLDPASEDADRIVILRHTLMNPFLIDSENGINYIDRYLDFLARRLGDARLAA